MGASPSYAQGFRAAWSQGLGLGAQDRFSREAKVEFAAVGAPESCLIARANAADKVLVTHEAYVGRARKRAAYPNVCRNFDISYVKTFETLRVLVADLG